MKSATAICLPGEIKNFPVGEQESTALVAVQAQTLSQLLEELKKLIASRERDRDEILFLKEKIATLEAAVAGQDKKSDQGHRETLFLKEKIASHGTKIDTLEAATTSHNAKLVILESAVDDQDKKIVALETAHDKDIERIAMDAAYDRQRVAKLEQKEPQPLQKDRGEILRALIATNGGKMLAKYARLKMHLDKATFSRLLGTLSDHVTRKVHQRDRRQKLLVLNIS
jgi:chromosome segregation ATPase